MLLALFRRTPVIVVVGAAVVVVDEVVVLGVDVVVGGLFLSSMVRSLRSRGAQISSPLQFSLSHANFIALSSTI